jgi:hypothetical protein
VSKGSDESDLSAQVAGIVAMISALIKSLPAANRKRLLRHIVAEYDALSAAMSSAGASQADRDGAQWMRDLFLKRIAALDSKPVHRKRSKPAQNSPAVTTRPRKPVDFEL